MLCNYGCGEEALFKLKNGKYCCQKSSNSCKEFRRKNSNSHKGLLSGKNHPLFGKKHLDESKQKMSKSHIGIQLGEKHPLFGKHPSKESIQKRIEKIKGKPSWNRGLKTGPLSKDTIKKLSLSHKGKKKSKEHSEKIRQRMLNGGGKHAASFITQEFKEQQRQRMLNGQAAKMNKCIKNPSKPELMLREMIKQLYPEAEPQFTIFNYSVDIALTEQKIAIKFDGWYHFDTEEHKEYHKFRQEKIEKEGWKFLRYNISQPFPFKEQIKNDINKLLEDL